MMNNDVYLQMNSLMKECLNQLDLQIFDDMDNYNEKYSNYMFTLLFELQKGLHLCCVGIELQAYSQIASLLRQLLEQAATVIVLINYPKCREKYDIFSKIRFRMLNNQGKDVELDNLYNQLSKKNKMNKLSFSEYGWLLEISDYYGVEELMKKANIDDLISWRKFFNNFVHNKIFFSQYSYSELLFENQISELIYHIAIIFDQFMCCYHNYGKQSFIFNLKNYRDEFIEIFNLITSERQKNK